MKWRKFTYFLICFLAITSSFTSLSGQVQLNFFLNPNAPPEIYKWSLIGGPMAISVNLTGGQPMDVRFQIQFKTTDGKVAATTDGSEPVVTLQPGLNSVNSGNIFQTDDLNISDDFRSTLGLNRRFPDGIYDCCISVYSVSSGTLVSDIECRPFHIEKLQSPLLIFPPDEYQICGKDLMNTVFQWTPVYTQFPTGCDYQFVLSEIYPGQSSLEALNSNIPIIEQYFPLNTTIFRWPENQIPPGDSQSYVWAVQLVNYQREVVVPFSQAFTTQCRPKKVIDSFVQDSITIHSTPEKDTFIIEPGACTVPYYSLDKGSNLALGMLLDNPKKAPYPRAVPLRADGMDFDLVRMHCNGCTGIQSTVPMAVMDIVGDYQWTLLSKYGSLNTPFDVESADSLAKEIAKIQKRLLEISEESKEIEDWLSKGMLREEEQLKNAIEKLKKELDNQSKRKVSLQKSLDSIGMELKKLTNGLKLLKNQIDVREKEIKLIYQEIDSLVSKIKGKPGEAELALQQKISKAQDRLKILKNKQIADENAYIAELDQLQKSLIRAQELVEKSVKAYNKEKNKLESLAGIISSIETKIMANPDGKQFLIQYKDWSRKCRLFLLRHKADEAAFNATSDAIIKTFATLNTERRLQHFADFQNNARSFINQCNQICNGNAACKNEVLIVENSSNLFSLVGSDLLKGSLLIDPNLIKKMDSLRRLIDNAQGSLQSFKNAVDNATKKLQEAQDLFNQKQKEIESKRADINKQISETEAELLELQGQLKKAIEIRQREEDIVQKDRQIRLKDLKIKLFEKESELLKLKDSLNSLENTQKALIADKALVESNIASVEQSITALKSQIKTLEAEKEKLQDKKKTYEKRLKDLEVEKKDLEAILAKLLAQKSTVLQGTKTASGPFVYYIPPPLEEIIKDAQKFNELKDSVSKAESDLIIAFDQKVAIQKKLVAATEKAAALLVKLKQSTAAIPELEKIISELDDEIKKLKTQSYQEQLDKQKKAQEAVSKADLKLKELEKEKEKTEQEIENKKTEIENLTKEIEAKEGEVKALDEENKALFNELKYEQQLLENSKNTLNNYQLELAQTQNELQEKELQLSRLKNDLTRATAVNTEGEGENIRQKIQEVEANLNLLKNTKTPSLQGKIQSASKSIESAVKRVEAVQLKEEEFLNRYKKILEELQELRDQLIKENEHFEGLENTLVERERRVKELEKRLESANKKKEEINEEIENEAMSSEEVKGKQEEKEEAEESLKTAKDTKEKSKNELIELQAKTKILLDVHKSILENAKSKLEQKKKELYEFLLKEFESVSFEVKIQLQGADFGSKTDKWRTTDGVGTIVQTLVYPGNRIPVFDGRAAQSGAINEDIIKSICNPDKYFDIPELPEVSPPSPGAEPRTIALVYKNGEPLFAEWPVIPNKAPLLAMDVIAVMGGGKDEDQFIRKCTDSEICPPTETKDVIRDLGSFIWEADGTILGSDVFQGMMIWETKKLDKPKINEEQKNKFTYQAQDFAPDTKKEATTKPVVKVGVLLECSKDTTGSPEQVYTLQGRTVTGDHKGLAGEDITFEVSLEKGQATGYGFDGTSMMVVKKTNELGYARVPFNFGKGYALFNIKIIWKRGGQIVEESNMKAISPLLLRIHRFGTGAPAEAFEAALNLLNSGGDPAAAAAGLPDAEDGEESEGITLRAVGGLMNHDRNFVNDEIIKFRTKSVNKPKPEKGKTEVWGITKTEVTGIEDGEACEIIANIEEKYKPVGRPDEASKEYSNQQLEQFKIGKPEFPFVIIMDEPFNPNEPLSGSGRLGMEVAGNELLQYLKEVKFEVTDVQFSDPNSEDLMANEGQVAWEPGSIGEIKLLGLEFALKKVSILAQNGAAIEGSVKHSSLKHQVDFKAELDADGNFLGSVDSLPEISVKNFKLKEGTAFDIDMHANKSPGNLEGSFQGLLIRSAKLELPEVFQGADKTPTLLEVSNFYIGSRYASNGSRSMGFGGKAALSGAFFKMGYAGYELITEELSLEFENSALVAGGIKGQMNLPIPFEGKIGCEISVTGEGFSAVVSTNRPVTLPKFGMSMTFLNGCGIEYKYAEKIGSLTINAYLITKSMGEIEIKGFKVSSNGEIEAKEITLEASLKVGSGFQMHARSFSFSKTQQEYSATVQGGFSFPSIGIENITGSVTVSSGPALSIELKKGVIKFDYDPVKFSGEFEYSGREFRGKFDIGIKKLCDNGIDGKFVVGNIENETGNTYTYWYAELSVGTKIVLGQTGMAILKLGGGLGYNYTPPIGANEGFPVNSNAFSFKAIVEAGTLPGGEVFAGRMEMVLTSQMFSLYGKTWLLTKKESIYGKGLLNLEWSPKPSINGFIAMYVGLPGAGGELFEAQGKVNFRFDSPSQYFIESEKIAGSLFQVIKADGTYKLNPTGMLIAGKLSYNLNKTLPFVVVTAHVALNLSATASLQYVSSPASLNANAEFTGDWDVDLETPMGNADIISGAISLNTGLQASPSVITFSAKANISYSVWIYSDTLTLDLGFKQNIY